MAASADPASVHDAERELALERRQRERDEADLRFIARASAELAAITDYRETLVRIAQLAVPHFADWVTVDMLVDGDRLERLAVAHVDPSKVAFASRLYERFPPNRETRTGAWRAVRSGSPVFIPEVTAATLEATVPNPEYRDAILALGVRSYMCVPMLSRGRVLGAISFVTSDSERIYTERDLANVMDLAARAAVAIENAELVQALREADAAKDVFLATLAHELRNPLAPIMNAINILRLPQADESTRTRMLDMTERQVRHLVRLVDDLLEISRITRGKVELRRERMDLRDVVRGAVEAASSETTASRHTMKVVLAPRPVIIDADRARMKQVVDNLLGNAQKYTPEGGWIAVEVAAEESHAVLRVRDNGVGIPPEMLGKVFDMFTQVDRNQGGLGIGLALVKQLVQLHDGTARADSMGPGAGATFTIRLPLAEASHAEPARTAAPIAKTDRPRRVLIIDDNVDAADTLAMLIASCGHEVRSAYDGESGIAAAERLRPDCVFLDLGMPGMSGHEVARVLRTRECCAGARIVALTGWGQQQDRELTREAGFDAHLVKPADADAVLKILEGD